MSELITDEMTTGATNRSNHLFEQDSNRLLTVRDTVGQREKP
jgi:hypothetical protein